MVIVNLVVFFVIIRIPLSIVYDIEQFFSKGNSVMVYTY